MYGLLTELLDGRLAEETVGVVDVRDDADSSDSDGCTLDNE